MEGVHRVVHGRDPSGSPWTGVGVSVFNSPLRKGPCYNYVITNFYDLA